MSHLDTDTPYIGDPDKGDESRGTGRLNEYEEGSGLAAAFAGLPPTTVKRGGMKWPDASEADYAQKFASYERHMVAERIERRKRMAQWMSTVRVLGVLGLLALVLLGMMDALPWQ
jgi:hypothetical protein